MIKNSPHFNVTPVIAFAFLAMLFGYVSSVFAQQNFNADLFSDEPEFLPVDQAFQFDFYQKEDQLTLTWQIAEGYYLYKKQFKTVVKQAELGEPNFPASQEVEDEFFGISEAFFNDVAIQYPIIQSVNDGVVKIQYQGCAEAGLCYPPTTKVVYLSEVIAANERGSSISAAGVSTDSGNAAGVSEQFELQNLLNQGDSLPLTLLLFLALGIGLAFTPCVFPMYPIISGIVIGQGNNASMSRTFSLSFVYVQGMALTYSLLGLVVASAGVQFQAALQHPAILITMIIIFVALAAAMFGAYEIQLPSSWQVKLNEMSNQQKQGSYVGVFMMGVISGLVASPCTTAPLTGILLYIAQSGDLLLGFSALYMLSLGMGIPLIAFALTGGKLLPKAGAWMNIVKVSFGFMMLAVALVFVERMYDNMWTGLGWALLGLSAFSYYQVVNQDTLTSFAKGVRAFVIFLGLFASAGYGAMQLGLVTASDTQSSSAQQANGHAVQFKIVKDFEDFENKLLDANAMGKTVMIDLYADWCVACKEFDKYTFPDARVQAALDNTEWLQIDLTDNTPENLRFQEEFSVLGLPTIMFFDETGEEIASARVTGFMKAEKFAAHVEHFLPKN